MKRFLMALRMLDDLGSFPLSYPLTILGYSVSSVLGREKGFDKSFK